MVNGEMAKLQNGETGMAKSRNGEMPSYELEAERTA